MIKREQNFTFSGTTIDSLNNVDELLGVLESPVDLIIVTSAQIDHDMLIAVEEHCRARIVQFVHFIEVGDLGYVNQVDGCKVFDLFGDFIKNLVIRNREVTF